MPQAAPRTRKWSAILDVNASEPHVLRIAGEVATHCSNETPILKPRARQFSASMLALELSLAGEAGPMDASGWKIAEYCHSAGDDVSSVEIYCGSQRLQSLDIKRAH